MRLIEFHPKSLIDIEDIATHGISKFGVEQAALYHDEMFKQFELLAEYPQLGRLIESNHLEIYRFGYGSHVILYSLKENKIVIRRILHGHMDILRHI